MIRTLNENRKIFVLLTIIMLTCFFIATFVRTAYDGVSNTQIRQIGQENRLLLREIRDTLKELKEIRAEEHKLLKEKNK